MPRSPAGAGPGDGGGPQGPVAGAARGRSGRDRELRGLREAHHGRVDGGPDPSFQNGHRRRRRSPGRGARAGGISPRRAGLLRRLRRRSPAVPRADPGPLVRHPPGRAVDGGGRPGGRRHCRHRQPRPGHGRGGPLMPVLSPELRADAERIMSRYPEGRERSAIMPLLYLVQSAEGRLTREGLKEVADLLGLKTAEVEAVASFYTMLRLRPTGRYVVSVCTNLACALRGATEVYAKAREVLGPGSEDVTEDGAFPQTLLLVKGERPVLGHVLRPGAQHLAGLRVHLRRPAQGAREVRAYRDDVSPGGTEAQHGVEARHGLDLRRLQPQEIGHLLQALAGDAALVRLHQVQERHDGRALPAWGVPGQDPFGIRPELGREHRHQRSTPPMTGSTLAMAAITSATRPPSTMDGTAWRLTNEGSRIRTRYGRWSPSETTE